MIKIKNTNKKLKKKTWFTFTSQQISDAESTEEFLFFKAQSKKKKQRGNVGGVGDGISPIYVNATPKRR